MEKIKCHWRKDSCLEETWKYIDCFGSKSDSVSSSVSPETSEEHFRNRSPTSVRTYSEDHKVLDLSGTIQFFERLSASERTPSKPSPTSWKKTISSSKFERDKVLTPSTIQRSSSFFRKVLFSNLSDHDAKSGSSGSSLEDDKPLELKKDSDILDSSFGSPSTTQLKTLLPSKSPNTSFTSTYVLYRSKSSNSLRKVEKSSKLTCTTDDGRCPNCKNLQPVYRICRNCDNGFKYYCLSEDCWNFKRDLHSNEKIPLWSCFNCCPNDEKGKPNSLKCVVSVAKELAEKRIQTEMLLGEVENILNEEYLSASVPKEMLRDIERSVFWVQRALLEAIFEEDEVLDQFKERNQKFLEDVVDVAVGNLEDRIECLKKLKIEDECVVYM